MRPAARLAAEGAVRQILSAGSLNLVLRAATLLAKFVLLVYFGRYLSLYDLGAYGILSSSIALAIQLLGLDFYVFNAREILASTPARQVRMVRDQLALHGIAYIVLLPGLIVVFTSGILPWSLVGWFYVLVVLEHLSQELARLLTTIARPVLANVVEFLRMGSWAGIVVAGGIVFGAFRTVEAIVGLWALGVGVSLAVGAWGLRQWDWRSTLGVRPDVRWWLRGIRIAVPFMVGTAALKTIELSDRFILQFYHGEEQVGVFTFHQSVAGLVTTAVVTGLVMVVYPHLVRAHLQGDAGRYRHFWRLLGTGTIGGSVAAIAVLVPLFPVLTALMGKQELISTRQVFWILLGAAFFHNASMAPHYALYARHFDRDLMWAAVAPAAVNVVLSLLWIPQWGVVGAAWATAVSFSMLCGVKWVSMAVRSGSAQWARTAG